jgi:hypothetical protein
MGDKFVCPKCGKLKYARTECRECSAKRSKYSRNSFSVGRYSKCKDSRLGGS